MAVYEFLISLVFLSCISTNECTQEKSGVIRGADEESLREFYLKPDIQERFFVQREPFSQVVEIGLPGIVSMKLGVDREKGLVLGASAGMLEAELNIGGGHNHKNNVNVQEQVVIENPTVIETVPIGSPTIVETIPVQSPTFIQGVPIKLEEI